MSENRPLFSDMPTDPEEAAAIEWAVRLGLFRGHTDGTFRPGDPISRGQAAILEQRRARSMLALVGYATRGLRDRCMSAVVQVGDYINFPSQRAGVGSGVVVHPDGWVITCHHVIEEYMKRHAADPHGTDSLVAEWGHGPMLARCLVMSMVVAATDPDNDLALLLLAPNNMQYHGPYPWMRLAATEEVPGEPVVVMGAPLGNTAWESHGFVAREEQSMLYHKKAQWLIAVAGAINPGNSGGALIRASDGTLLGVPAMKPDIPIADGMGWAIHWRYVKALLDRVGIQQPE